MSPVARTYCGDDVRQPEQIVGTAGAQPAAGRFVPPVLHVAFDELTARRAEQVRARELGPRERQRHHVLQLIAKAERAAGLVVAAARPEPAADRLVQQPVVQQRIERIVRGSNLHGAERLSHSPHEPVASAACAAVDVAVACDQLARVIAIVPSPSSEQDLAAFSRAAGRIESEAPRRDPDRRRRGRRAPPGSTRPVRRCRRSGR